LQVLSFNFVVFRAQAVHLARPSAGASGPRKGVFVGAGLDRGRCCPPPNAGWTPPSYGSTRYLSFLAFSSTRGEHAAVVLVLTRRLQKGTSPKREIELRQPLESLTCTTYFPLTWDRGVPRTVADIHLERQSHETVYWILSNAKAIDCGMTYRLPSEIDGNHRKEFSVITPASDPMNYVFRRCNLTQRLSQDNRWVNSRTTWIEQHLMRKRKRPDLAADG
jgi:hypothetical protein